MQKERTEETSFDYGFRDVKQELGVAAIHHSAKQLS